MFSIFSLCCGQIPCFSLYCGYPVVFIICVQLKLVPIVTSASAYIHNKRHQKLTRDWFHMHVALGVLVATVRLLTSQHRRLSLKQTHVRSVLNRHPVWVTKGSCQKEYLHQITQLHGKTKSLLISAFYIAEIPKHESVSS